MEYRCTKQYQAIYDYVKKSFIHPTAENVYEAILRQYPHISLKTVYRNLYKLADEGKILRISIANQKDRFDGRIDHHYHLCCQKCGNFMDVNIDYQYQLNEAVEQKTNYKIAAHSIIFKGICPRCLNQKLKEK